MKHVLSSEQFKREDLEEIFKLTDKVRNNTKDYAHKLDDKVIAVMFYEPSTRTRLSFETAALKLGAKIITTENAGEFSSAAKGETIQDTVKVISGYADAMVIRHTSDTSAEDAASVNKMPILNAGAGKGEHPTQSLLDLYTIEEKKGKIDGIKVPFKSFFLYSCLIYNIYISWKFSKTCTSLVFYSFFFKHINVFLR